MGSGDYINKLVEGVRGEIPKSSNGNMSEPPLTKNGVNKKENKNVDELLEAILDFRIEGETRRLIRMDSRVENIFKHVNYLFGINVTSLVNFLCLEFLKENPELINEIKKSLKQLEL